MNDEKTAADYKVSGGSVLHLVLALDLAPAQALKLRVPAAAPLVLDAS